MKKLFTLLFGAFAFAGHAQTVYPSGATGCIARYDFTSAGGAISTLPDVSANNNSGIARNLQATAGWYGRPNMAMLFAGDTSSYAIVHDSGSLHPQQITMISLVRFDGFYSGSCQESQILSKGYPNNVAGNYGIGTTDNVYDNGNCNSFDSLHQQLVASYGTLNPSQNITAGNYVQRGRWYFMAAATDGSTLDLYQQVMDTANYNSALSPIFTYTNFSGTLGTNTQDLSIGKHLNPPFPYDFKGAMDEVALFNRKLTTTEIQGIYRYLWQRPTGINEVSNQKDDFAVWADNGQININSLRHQDVGNMVVYNIAGQVLYSGKPTGNTDHYTINSSDFRDQMIFVKISSATGIATFKIMN